MLQEGFSDDQQVLGFPAQVIAVDSELAEACRLVHINFGGNFENLVAEDEADWLELGFNVVAGHLRNLAEVIIGCAIQSQVQRTLPFVSQRIEQLWRQTNC